MALADQIRIALDSELESAQEFSKFRVERRVRDGTVWRLTVLPSNSSSKLDEALEGNKVWWLKPQKGGGEVLSVLPEEMEINLRFATSGVPGVGEDIYIYPADFLKALRRYWGDSANAAISSAWLKEAVYQNEYNPINSVSVGAFGELRCRQVDAFKLPGWRCSFLWGPPGTGKTYTLGALLAQYLAQFPDSRVLLLSTTNNAVDLALISVDKALERLSKLDPGVGDIRRKCSRLGHNFVSSSYVTREHLVPVRNHEQLKKLTKLESQQPDKKEVEAYKRWKERVEALREQIRAEMRDALYRTRLAAMTTTRAVFTLDDLKTLSYDLIVFDEASQVSIAHSLAIAPLGKACLFAGDHKQLAPIASSSNEYAREWLAKPMFKYKDESAGKAACTLNEQSRMDGAICKLISNVFYPGTGLKVADDVANDEGWKRQRRRVELVGVDSCPVSIFKIVEDGKWSQKYGGKIRYESAAKCVDIAKQFVATGLPEKLYILTPFRAQRNLIKAMLKQSGCGGVRVTTVHKAQGGERHTIVYDPVDGDDNFLRKEHNPDAPRLLNVALSRAMAQVVLLLSSGDCNNPLYKKIASFAEGQSFSGSVEDISLYVNAKKFPRNCVGKVVRFFDCVGRVQSIVSGSQGPALQVEDFNHGAVRTFFISRILDAYRTDDDRAVFTEPESNTKVLPKQPVTKQSVTKGATEKAVTVERKNAKSESQALDALPCPLCRRTFDLKRLRRHIRTVHERELDKYVACDACGTELKAGNLVKHYRRYHSVPSPEKSGQKASAGSSAVKRGGRSGERTRRWQAPALSEPVKSTNSEIQAYLERNPGK